jgi:hypothetical protein
MKTWSRNNILWQNAPRRVPTASILLLLLLNMCRLQTAVAQEDTEMMLDTIVVSRLHSGSKYKIRIYPNATHEVLFFTANGEENKVYQLFLFDVEGKLVKQTAVNNRQTGFLSKFTKGNYVYEVFSDDERIENGNIVIR